jgi:O-antigen/teichoic acid export membrane protein
MLNTAVVLYLGSRGVSAAGNLLAVAVFTRMAGPAEYGHYVLIFAWSMIVYGFGAQWMRFAYFGVYQSRCVDEYVAALVQLLAAAIAMLAVGFSAIALTGLFEPVFLAAVFALVGGMAIYEAAFEVTRTRLNARLAALSMILRTCLTVVLGSLTLWSGGAATGLALAIALAHVIAAVPCLTTLAGVRLSQSSRSALTQMLRYGWPLLLSFGVTAVGQTIDRVLLAHFAGPAALGPYGVVADILRQSFTVVGEAIILSLVTVAKQHANEGDVEGSNRALQTAFNACLTAAAFGAAFFLVFGEVVLRVLLGAEFVAPGLDLIPIFAVAFAFITMRNFYFAQVIYFTHASFLELMSSVVFVLVSGGLSLVLIPGYGARGAALALLAGSVVSCLAFVLAGRRFYRLPIDLVGLGEIPLLAGCFVLASRAIGEAVANAWVLVMCEAFLFIVLSAFVIQRFGLLQSPPGPGAIPSRCEATSADGEELRVHSRITSASLQ